MGKPALTPGPYFKAVLVLALPSSAVDRVRASPGLCQVGAVCTSVHWCGQDISSPVLQASSAGFAATWPGGEGWNYTVLGAGDETRLLHRWFLGKELTYPRGDCGPVWSAYTVDFTPLDAMLCCNALGRPQRELVGKERGENTAPPVRHLPLKEVLVPVAHLKAVSLAFWLVHVLAVGVVGSPALHVDAPYRPRLNPARATVLPDTVAPLACNREQTHKQGIFIKTWRFRKKKKKDLNSSYPAACNLAQFKAIHLTSVIALFMNWGRKEHKVIKPLAAINI